MSEGADVETLERRLDDLTSGVFEQIGALRDRVEQLEQENEDLREKLDEANRKASNAMGVAKATDNGARADGGPSKKDRAKLTARNELVKRTLLDASSAGGSSLTVGEVQTMLRPGTDVAYQTVKDAMTRLVSEWSAFYLGENENGDRALKVKKHRLDEDLVGAVEVDLDRDDLTKRLHSRRKKETV